MEIQLTPEQESLLERAAANRKRPKAELVNEAIRVYLEHESWFAQAVEQGREAARHGNLLEHEEVVTRIERRFGD